MSSPVPPSLHTVPAVDSGVPQPPDWAQLQAWGATLITQLEQWIALALLNVSILGVKPFVALQNFGNEALGAVSNLQGLVDSLANALGFPGTGHTNTNIQTYFTTVGGQIQNLAVTGLYDVSQGFDNIGTSLLKYLTPTGGNIGQFDASGLFGNLNTALSLQGVALSSLFNSSGAYIGAIDAAATGTLNTALTFGGHALSTVLGGINAATGDFVGAVDSAATIAGQTASTVQANAQGALDSIVQAAKNDGSLVNQAVSDAKAELVYLFSGLNAAFTGGNISSPPAASVTDAVTAAGAIQERLATIGNGGEESVDIEFSTYSNGALPADWTVIGTNNFSITGGLFQWSGTGSGTAFETSTPTLSDYQSVSATFQSISGSPQPYIVARGSSTLLLPTFIEYVGGSWQLYGGGILLATFTDTLTFGDEYTLLAGDPVAMNPRHFQFLKSGTALTVASVSSGSGTGTTTWSDDSAVTNLGAGYRETGMGATTNGSFTVSSFKYQDTAESEPTAFVQASESTSSSSYSKLTTASDRVAVNIGASGKVLVILDANSSSANGFVSFAASGANTISASDDNAGAGNIGAVHSEVLLTKQSTGLTVFDMEYRSSSGSATFSRRRITALAI